MTNYRQFFSDSAVKMRRSEIRELLKLTRKPGIISFAGGLPAPQLFPVEEIKEITCELMDKVGTTMMQYGPTEGDNGLREELVKLMKEDGIEDMTMERMFITTSSQQGLDLIGKILISPGDIIMTSKPTYVGALGAFNSYQAEIHGIRSIKDEGIDTDALEREVKRLVSKNRKPKAIYVVPDFQNPDGITLSLEKRQEIIRIAEENDLLIIEDSPYRQLRFEGETMPPMISLCPARIVSLYTFSKILIPGFRLGWMAGPKEIIEKAIIAKQSVDLCAPPYTQMIVAEYLRRGLLGPQIERIIDVYRDNRDLMLEKLDEYMPKVEGLHWTRPEGGLFLWVTLPNYMNANNMFLEAVEKKVAYVVGSAFDPEGMDTSSFRMNFSYASQQQIADGVKRLAEVIEERLEFHKTSAPIAP